VSGTPTITAGRSAGESTWTRVLTDATQLETVSAAGASILRVETAAERLLGFVGAGRRLWRQATLVTGYAVSRDSSASSGNFVANVSGRNFGSLTGAITGGPSDQR
jgi:hypothetical protein